MTFHRAQMLLAVLFSTVFLSGCLYERISWSPDGQHVAYVGPEYQGLWVWDLETRKAEKVQRGEVYCCKFLPDGKGLLYGLAHQGSVVSGRWGGEESAIDVHVCDIQSGGDRGLVNGILPYNFDVSPDGEDLFFITEDEATELHRFQKLRISNTGEKTEILSATTVLGFPRVHPNGSLALVATGTPSIDLVYLNEGRSETLARREAAWSDWVDEERFVYIAPPPGEVEAPEVDGITAGSLYLYSLANSTTKEIARFVPTYLPPSVALDGQSVFVTAFTGERRGGSWQVVRVDLTTGETQVCTDEVFGTGLVQVGPEGRRVAYLAADLQDGEMRTLRILDLESSETVTAWRDEEERLIAAAEGFVKIGELAQAEATYVDLLNRFPDSRFGDLVHYSLVSICTNPLLLDLDRAFEMFDRLRSGALRKQARPFIWREENRVVSDPPEDWIQTYGTPEAVEEYDFNTDLTRDLLGLSALWSDSRLYIRIDFNSPQDLTGLTFQDTVLLLNANLNSTAQHRFDDRVEWDRGVDRVVYLRHWYRNGDKSRYDVEIRNGKGETISHLQASGFEGPNYPHLRVVDSVSDWENQTGSMVLSLSREILGLKGSRDVSIQVCTLKGGIESLKGKERVTGFDTPGGAILPVADAFGGENSLERTKARIASDGSFTVQGVAGVLPLLDRMER